MAGTFMPPSVTPEVEKDGDSRNSTRKPIVKKSNGQVKGSGKRERKGKMEDCEFQVLAATKKRKTSDSEDDDIQVDPPSRVRPRRAAAATSLKEKTCAFDIEYVTPKEEKMCMLEQEALVLTSQGKDEARILIDFEVQDEDGCPQPLEVVGSQDVYISGLMLPKTANLDMQRAYRVEGMGPISVWGIEGYDEGEAVISISTGLSDYICLKPLGKYKNYFKLLYEKTVICVEVYRALNPSTGGDPNLGLNDLYARVARSLRSGKNSSLLQFFSRDYFVQQGEFIAGQLKELDADAQDDDQLFSGLPALEALEDECVKRIAATCEAPRRPGTLKIQEPSPVNTSNRSYIEEDEQDAMDADEKLARHLQEVEDRNATSRQGRKMQPAGKGKVYIKINEDEIAADYPLPAFYKAEEEETDEYILFDDDNVLVAPEELPRRMLHDWSLYNADSRLISLELLPMLAGAETDIEIFGSGVMTEDDGCGFNLDEVGEDASQAAGGSGSIGPSTAGHENGTMHKEGSAHGIRIYLSAVKEWMIEFGANMVFISIRTDGAWYRLAKPSRQYMPWYTPVLKTARLAIEVITMLKQEQRVSRLSFTDVVKRLTEQLSDGLKFNNHKLAEVERYAVVHGQIILQQFAEFPDEKIRRSAFVSGLMTKMEQKHHTKLVFSKKKLIKKGRNLNPRAHLQPDARKSKPMRATTTQLVNRIWSGYYTKYNLIGEVTNQVKEEAIGAQQEVEVEEEAEVEEESEGEDDPISLSPKPIQKKPQQLRDSKKIKKVQKDVKWVGSSVGRTLTNELVYKKATINGEDIVVGAAVLINIDDDLQDSEQVPAIVLVEYLYQATDGSPMIHGRIMAKSCETVLGNAGDEREVFLTDACADIDMLGVRSVVVELKRRPEGHAHRKANAAMDQAERGRAKERETKGLPMEYFCRALYAPDKGAFFSLPQQKLAVGDGTCHACKLREEEERLNMCLLLDDDGFRLEGVEYREGDFLYVDPSLFKCLLNKDDHEAEIIFKGGRNKGLRPFAICQLLSVQKTKKNPMSTKLSVRRFYRPDDFGTHKGYIADIHEASFIHKLQGSVLKWQNLLSDAGKLSQRATAHSTQSFRKTLVNQQDLHYACPGDTFLFWSINFKCNLIKVYYSEDTATVEMNAVRGRCEVLRPAPILDTAVKAATNHVFFCSCFCDPKDGTVKQLPANVKLGSCSRLGNTMNSSGAVAELAAKAKGKGKAVENEGPAETAKGVESHDNRLATLDIFAGCGGLSEGLHQAEVSNTKWAIEYEDPAAEAFKLNHPKAEVFCENCNVILRCIMERGDDLDDCLSTPEAGEMASKISNERKSALPKPGEVDFINGGPPCQGFSGMNRFNTGAWSKVQCEMILGFLSYAEYFRPRYFLLENVRNFVSFNKGQTFRLTLATLLEMGYQVRFGVLQAGNYGVSQSRKRAFIWAAAPDEVLPDWPEPMHVFSSSQLKISLPGGLAYAAVRDAGKGAPLRAITVKDTMYDLPPVENGASKEEIKYGDPPVSWFQKQIRGSQTVLYNHIAKEMNELNLERCKRIPKYPGADWRSLPEEKVRLSTGQLVDLIPWCLPNTADRHNQWKGLFGRLDWEGNFPTSVTDPQPMGKVGMCFHPEQDRIVTVRECARSQGFPDGFQFSGTIQSKHRQIGNAVPPPLARALGLKLKEVIQPKNGTSR